MTAKELGSGPECIPFGIQNEARHGDVVSFGVRISGDPPNFSGRVEAKGNQQLTNMGTTVGKPEGAIDQSGFAPLA